VTSQVAIITALAPRPGHRLQEIHRALDAAAAEWEWLIQVDEAATGELPATLIADPRVAIEANGERLGIAGTRNRALARSHAPVLLNADSDDVPAPGAVDRLTPAFADPTVGLAFGDWIEHWPDREPWASITRFTPGRHPPGMLAGIWHREHWVPFHLAGAMWRTDAVLAAGGWSALLGGSDIGLLIGVDAAWASVYVPGPTFTYHHHSSQATASRAWQAQFARDLRFLQRRYEALHPSDTAEVSDGAH
jgi:cellulose synthase/poly-beta-1,6-N-acetylglucosamine synthase-like glycosyltransferase